MVSVGQGFGWSTAGMACVCSPMSVASARKALRWGDLMAGVSNHLEVSS